MSALVDIWTDEFAKLRQNGQTLFSSGPRLIAAESSQAVPNPCPRLEKSSIEVAIARAFVGRVMRVNSNVHVLPCSEGSVSMLVQCFSPMKKREMNEKTEKSFK